MIRILIIPLILFLGSISYAQDTFTEESELEWYSMEKAQELAKEQQKKVLIFGDALWCTYCKKMKSEVYPDAGVIAAVEKYFYPVLLNSESEQIIKFNGIEVSETELARAFRMSGTPTHYFLNPEGKVLGQQPGFIPAEIFERLLSFVGSDAFLNQKFDEYQSESSSSGNPE